MNVDPRLYYLMRRLKDVKQKYFYSEKIRLLDVGCADGSFMQVVSNRITNVERVDGVDVPSGWLREDSVKKTGNLYIQDLQHGTGELRLKMYHVVTLWEVIEHIENVYAFMRNIRKVLTRDGILLISTPNLCSLSRLIKGNHWVGISDNTHKYLFDPLSLSMVIERSGFCLKGKVESILAPSLGEKFDSLNNRLAFLPLGGMLFAAVFANKFNER